MGATSFSSKRWMMAALLLLGAGTLGAGCGSSDDSGLSGTPGAECKSNGECGGSEPFCLGHLCVECQGNGDCQAPELCNADAGRCTAACESAAQCDGERPICSPAGICVRCNGSGDCGGEDPFCNKAIDRCVECREAADCGAAQPICTIRGNCVECGTDRDCGAGQSCHENECVQTSCTSDSQCNDERPHCNADNGQCVECLNNEHCAGQGGDRNFCAPNHECVECLENVDCGAGRICEGGGCHGG